VIGGGKRQHTMFALLGLLGCACATTPGKPTLVAPAADAQQAWRHLREGEDGKAEQVMNQALLHDPADARALFAAMNLAYERGDDPQALARALALLESAVRGEDTVAVGLAAATLVRVPRLLAEIPDPRPSEDRLLALNPVRLPWQARYALALTVIDIARRRANATLLDKAVTQAGCVRALTLVAQGGRLPYLDLDSAELKQEAHPRALLPVACEHELRTSGSDPGIKEITGELSLAGGPYDLVLDYGGPARVRIDDGPWRAHGGSPDRFGARWSAIPIELSAGKHVVRLRLGTIGAETEVSVLALPAGPRIPTPERASGIADETMWTLANAFLASLTGDIDAMLEGIDRLGRFDRFAIGLSVAARLGETDPTRPGDIMRDRARAYWQQAVTLDPGLARVWLDLSQLELQNDRSREATDKARRAGRAAPGWWPAQLGLSAALRAQGLERPADDALAAGFALVRDGHGGCSMIERAFQRADEEDAVAKVAHMSTLLADCDAQNDSPRYLANKRGRLDQARGYLQRALPTSAEPLWLRSEIADIDLAQGAASAAEKTFAELAALSPRDTRLRLRLANAQLAQGEVGKARATVAKALHEFPMRSDVRDAARTLDLALPLDEFRLDGGKVIQDFLASGRSYQAPAVVVLDRAVERVFPDGTRMLLTHSITRVLSKDAIANVGEVRVPPGAEVLALRARKADGTIREAEEIAGKASVSVPNLEVGDFVETETIEAKDTREAFAPGFISERFYFQSFDAPLDRSEYVFIAPGSIPLDVDRRAGAPAAVETRRSDGTRVLSFVAREQPQVFPERAAVPAQEWIPSVHIASGVTVEAWSRYLAERFLRLGRSSPDIRRVADQIGKRVGADRSRLPEAIVTWVREHIEPGADYTEPATSTLARNRGNRAALMVALARALNVPADFVLARSLLAVAPDEPVTPADLDDFRELLVRFSTPTGARFVDPQIRRAPFAYLLPTYDGAPAVVVGSTQVVKATSTVKDSRSVTMRARLQVDGGARVSVTEQVVGWPAVEWTELLEQAGKDQDKLRQEFEQRWLGEQFPGAQLDGLTIAPGANGDATRVSYTFHAARMAAKQGSVLRLRPIFFQAQPGRRFGTEPTRKTALQLGYDIPLDLDAEIELPSGAKVLDLGQGGEVDVGKARFSEQRQVRSLAGGDVTIVLHRQSRLPISRVLPADYVRVAAKLRAVDPLEQSEIRIAVPGK
jgi:tetratricopeptide (TPR) repeat protein